MRRYKLPIYYTPFEKQRPEHISTDHVDITTTKTGKWIQTMVLNIPNEVFSGNLTDIQIEIDLNTVNKSNGNSVFRF